MKIIYNNIIPFEGFKCINLFGALFVRNGCAMTEENLNHEAIHSVQILEMIVVGLTVLLPFVLFSVISPWWLLASVGTFYYWYFIEWLIELFHYGTTAYHTNTFEREAHENDDDLTYLSKRPRFAWWKYVR